MTKRPITTIDLIRHGEPVGGKKYRGHRDDELSELGWQQMRDAVAEHSPWDVIISSPLKRCAHFAEELSQRYQSPLEIEPRLKEISFGDWEGRTAGELIGEDPDRIMRFWTDPTNNTPPNAETLHRFHERVIGAWQEILERHAGKHILIVGHAGMMRMIIREVLDMPIDRMYRLHVPNAGITRITVEYFNGVAFPRMHFHAGKL